jgi:glyoxalase family protein
MPSIEGLHHVTAIAGAPQANIDFYAGVLGLRLVKLTVNFHPGTILTFFPWPDAPRGRIGTGQLTVTSFAVPDRSLPYWRERLRKRSVDFENARSDFGEEMLFLRDADGLQLELVSTSSADPDRVWDRGPVPTEHAIRGFHRVTLSEDGYERTASLLTDTLSFRQIGREGNRFRYAAANGAPSTMVDLVCAPEARPGRVAVGTVHHVAWRTPTDAEQVQWRDILDRLEYDVTPIIDRQYFHSIYFREPGGVLFEIATDPPGFATDETVDRLGSSLKLPPWLEQARPELQRLLPPIELPTPGGGQADAAD